MELAIHWSPTNVQWVLALVDTGAEYTVLFGNPDRFLGLLAPIDGSGGLSIKVKALQLFLSIG